MMFGDIVTDTCWLSCVSVPELGLYSEQAHSLLSSLFFISHSIGRSLIAAQPSSTLYVRCSLHTVGAKRDKMSF